MARLAVAITSILVALLAGLAYVGRTLYNEETRYPFVYSLFGADPKLNAAWLSTETMLPCTKLEVIWARGSTEPSPLGYMIGPKFKLAIEKNLGMDAQDVLIIGLDYMATFELPLSPQTGIERLAERVRRRAKQCPDMSFALAGYSQGADVIYYALSHLEEQKDRIVALTPFAHPLVSIGWPPYYKGRVLNLCNPGDRGCGGSGLLKHFYYGANGTELHEAAAQFIAKKFREGPSSSRGPASLDHLPPPGSGGSFLLPWKAWPPREWTDEFKGGWVPPTVGLQGETMKDINIDKL